MAKPTGRTGGKGKPAPTISLQAKRIAEQAAALKKKAASPRPVTVPPKVVPGTTGVTAVAAPPRPAGGQVQRLDVVLGVDFGTRYTKVCFHVLDNGIKKVVVDPKDPTGLFPSFVYIDSARKIWGQQDKEGKRREVGYLKMLLCSPELGYKLGLQDLVQDDRAYIDCLAAFYLKRVIKKAKDIIVRQEGYSAGYRINWSTCISIPATYLQSEDRKRFRDVVDIAQKWAFSIKVEDGVLWEDLKVLYKSALQQDTKHDAAVVPEIVAGMHHVITSPDVQEGLHGFVDIGAGTIDGTIFRVDKVPGGRQIKILSTSVADLGSAVVAQKALLNLHRQAEAMLISDDPQAGVALDFEGYARDLEKFGHQLASRAAASCFDGKLLDNAADASSATLPRGRRETFSVHTTGGGARSEWYIDNVSGCERNRNHRRYASLGFVMTPLEAPAGFAHPNLDFGRFVVAWNLANEPANLERLKTFLPPDPDKVGKVPVREFVQYDKTAVG